MTRHTVIGGRRHRATWMALLGLVTIAVLSGCRPELPLPVPADASVTVRYDDFSVAGYRGGELYEITGSQLVRKRLATPASVDGAPMVVTIDPAQQAQIRRLTVTAVAVPEPAGTCTDSPEVTIRVTTPVGGSGQRRYSVCGDTGQEARAVRDYLRTLAPG